MDCVCFRRQIKKSKSVIQLLLFNESTENDMKCKNIKQTEVLVDLREGILQVNKFLIVVVDVFVTILFVFRSPDISYKSTRN